jgi:DNA-binding beta-propeller fold protein YncE
VSVLNATTNSAVSLVEVGTAPSDVAYDSGNGDVYVSNFEGGTISLISPTGVGGPHLPVTFSEVGLPAGTNWSVNLNGSTQHSVTASVNFTEPDGNYTYSIGAVPGYGASPSSGSILVVAAEISMEISFTPVGMAPPTDYSITVMQTGLPIGTSWSAELAGTTLISLTDSIAFSEPNGTYPLTVPAVGNYTADYSSPVLVGGASLIVAVAFSNVAYVVTFLESGLPAGSLWTVSATDVSSQTTSSGQSTGAAITLRLADGLYTLTAAGPTGYRVTLSASTVHVQGMAPPSLTVTFSTTPTGLVSTNSLPWLTIGVLVVTCLAAVVGAGWGYGRYRTSKWKTEALEWEQEFHNLDGPPGRDPPR